MHGFNLVHILQEKRNKTKQKYMEEDKRDLTGSSKLCRWPEAAGWLEWWPAAVAQGRGQEDTSSISNDRSTSCSVQKYRSRVTNNYLQTTTI
jgi:hypothetical protein